MRHWIIGAIVLCLVSVARAKAPATTQAFARDDIAGRVSDADGKPIEGALVDVWSWYKGNETHTDADGRFVLRKLGHDEPVEIRISKEGYGFWYKVDQPTGVEGLWVRLTSKTFFEGVVKAPDGKPVPHALVRADFGPKRNPGVTIGDVWVETTADDQGHYRMYVMPDAYEFHVRVPNLRRGAHC